MPQDTENPFHFDFDNPGTIIDVAEQGPYVISDDFEIGTNVPVRDSSDNPLRGVILNALKEHGLTLADLFMFTAPL